MFKRIVPVLSKNYSANNCRLPKLAQFQWISAKGQEQQFLVAMARCYSTQRLTYNIELLSDTPKPLAKLTSQKDRNKLSVERRPSGQGSPPLVVIMTWLMATRRQVKKYSQFYLDQGFDVLTVSCNPFQLLFPTLRGGKDIARDILTFLHNNPQYTTKTLHGFSVSGFIWSQVMAMMAEDKAKYLPVIDSIVGQVWDSPVDVEGTSEGVAANDRFEPPQDDPEVIKAMFPKNKVLKQSLEWYVRWHIKTFQNLATQHYLQSSVFYHNTIVRAPALFFCSEDDPCAFFYIVERAADRWEQLGVKVFMKSWKSSPHVSHYWAHPEEYIAELKAFMDKLGLLKYPEKVQYKKSVK